MTKEQYFEYLGIYKFWRAGYTGKNVRIMSDELIEKDYLNTDAWHKVICPKGYKEDASHGSSVMNIMLEVCPDATYYAYPFNANNGCSEYIQENKIHLFTCSNIAPSINKVKEAQMQDCIDKGCTFFIAGGNTNEKGVKGEAKSDKFLAIGICDFVNGKLTRVNPSAIGEELDYTMLPPFGRWTSWCSPTFTAMCGLVQDFFITNTGKALNREQLIKFIDDNLIDIGVEGHDVNTGKGLFILPEPSGIDISRYVTDIDVGEPKGDDDLNINYKFIDKSKYSLKCPYSMVPEFVVVHNTANDASAKNEIEYMSTNNVSTSFHIAVDDVEVIQAIPFDRNAFHAGDGSTGVGNRKGIAIEICYSKSGGERFEKAKNNAIELITDILIKYNWDISHVKKHQDFSNKYCPHRILDEGWDKFINEIQKRLEEKKMNEPSDWALEAWQWGVENHICDGTNPKGTITREQVVQMLYNYIVKGGK